MLLVYLSVQQNNKLLSETIEAGKMFDVLQYHAA